MTSLPYITHCFELSGDAGDIRITVERAGDPVELTIGTASWVLPPGLCIAVGKMLTAAGHSSIDGKRRQAARSEEAARADAPMNESGGGPVPSTLAVALSSSSPVSRRGGPDALADEDAAAFREHRLAISTADGEE